MKNVKIILLILTIVSIVSCLILLGSSTFALVKSTDVNGILDKVVTAIKDVKKEINDDPNESSSTTSKVEEEPVIDPIIEEKEEYQIVLETVKSLTFDKVGTTFEEEKIIKLDVVSLKEEVIVDDEMKSTILDGVKVLYNIENGKAVIVDGKLKLSNLDSDSFEDTLTITFELLKNRDDTNYGYVKDRVIKIDLSYHKVTPEENKEFFEKIYDNYDDKSADIQKKLMNNVINGAVGSKDDNGGTGEGQGQGQGQGQGESEGSIKKKDYTDAVTSVVKIYVDNLFDNIAENIEEGDEQAKEDFLSSESEAYGGLMEIVNIVLAEKTDYQPEEETIVGAIEDVVNSKVCTDTVYEAVEDPEVLQIVQKVSNHMGEINRENTEASFVEVATNLQDTDPEKYDTCIMLANLLNIDIEALLSK